MQALVVKYLGLGPEDRMLDVGCGTGWAVEHATQRCGVGFCMGIDLSPGMIENARRRRGHFPNVVFQQADAESLPLADESFDGAMCSFSFHHYSSPLKALAEIRRVLRPGAPFYVLDNNRLSFFGLYGLWDLYFRCFEPGHVRYLTPSELTRLFREARFNNVGTVYKQNRLFHGKKVFGSAMIVRGYK
jgi:ubiquinone/menaquinone biosynthesis C-methylase UbiE